MDSLKIKLVVSEAIELKRGERTPETVMNTISENMGKSPTFAVAIIQYLKDEGVDLMTLSGEQAEKFKSQFKPAIEKLNEQEVANLRRISSKLFGNLS